MSQQIERVNVRRVDQMVVSLIRAQRKPGIGPVAKMLLWLIGVDVPTTVTIGKGLRLPHSTTGFVLHMGTRISNDVTIWHGVTVGRADIWQKWVPGAEVRIGDGAILGANATVLVKGGEVLTIGAGSIVGAGSVLTQSTGENEVWAGNPARLVRTLERETA